MNPKFLVLYLIAGSVALFIAAYKFFIAYPAVNTGRIVLDVVISLFFYYLAYKAYHEKKDKELMWQAILTGATHTYTRTAFIKDAYKEWLKTKAENWT